MSETSPASVVPDDAPGLGEHADGPDRLVALSDGIFAIAMTILVLNISVPSGLGRADFRHALHDTWSQLGAYALSFAVIGGRWRDHRRVFQLIGRTDGTVVHLCLALLGAVALLPFPTALVADYGGSEPLAVTYYAVVVGAINLLLLALFLRAWRRPALQARPIPERLARGTIVDFGAASLIAVAAIVVAFAVSPGAGLLTWLAAFPAGVAARRLRGEDAFSD
ncbi:TMEM175 family protein [Catenulispora subtropica]|uniref:TMEM175 family protein n=1 Tax=Catenulispora subtropica TaxID=450798 RepID=A0ABP5DSY9_9ACTN